MTRKIKINILVSILFLILFFLGGYFFVQDDTHSAWGFLFLLFFAGAYSIVAGIITLIIETRNKQQWKSVLFITSCLANFIVSYIPILWLKSGGDVSVGLAVLFSLPVLIGIFQVIVFIKGFKREILSDKTI